MLRIEGHILELQLIHSGLLDPPEVPAVAGLMRVTVCKAEKAISLTSRSNESALMLISLHTALITRSSRELFSCFNLIRKSL